MKVNLSFEELIELAKSEALSIWGEKNPTKLLENLKEEIDELEAAYEEYMAPSDQDYKLTFNVAKEMGDVLFNLVRLSDELGIDLKEALAFTVVKMQEREKFGIKK